MSVVRYFTPENRLGKIITAPGGKRLTVAIEDATAELAQISDQCRQRIDEALESLHRLPDHVPPGPLLAEAYRTVREIAGLAGTCDLPDLGAAALAFCAFLDHAQDSNGLSAEHKTVHLNILRVLRRPELFSDSERSQVLAHLDLLVEKLAGKTPERSRQIA